MPLGYAVEEATTTQVVAAYAAPSIQIPAFEEADPPGWFVAGEFYLPLSVDAVRLDAIGFVANEDLTLQARLFDMAAVAEVTGSLATIVATTPTRALSGAVALTGNRRFQIQIRAYGGSGDEHFASLGTATITD